MAAVIVVVAVAVIVVVFSLSAKTCLAALPDVHCQAIGLFFF